MKGSLIVVGFFALGCLLGWSGWLPDVVIENDITVYVLYLLMFQVGLSIGSDKKLRIFSAVFVRNCFWSLWLRLPGHWSFRLWSVCCLRSGVYLIVWR